ncbi:MULTISPECIES: hypothetical protein [unclassified Rhodococcus (in: high G+C Gram-positive bacteria)]|uniref:hypothetical protein n=1 Tax=unclassified Rhodococcus (in: high G+C Gram-positive bacteria) TaxID=192944 RepID=UPI000701134B|nr:MULTISPECIES: hypothetical protein [unclassified Rhodococcus (in: high G+C Gram-positive bacteria)]KQU30354.1 hypothetical protein ASG69_04670 [Rhodococcus sp. Leaf225]KQU44741.1 hypothetical protein ASH03_12470 [Rhodococcus sp. Leaf258]
MPFKYPPRTPSAQPNIVGMVFDALADMLSEVPIIGDILAFIASLFGRTSTSNARLSRLEAIVSKGASGSDMFNRVDSATLGQGPGMPGPWVTGGNGPALGVFGNAAALQESIAPQAGRRWARYPVVASTSAMAVNLGVDDRALSSDDLTTIIVCANQEFTEGIAANVFGAGVYLARFARSGNTWTFADFAQDPAYKIERTQSIDLRANGTGTYSLWVENQQVLSGTSDLPIDAAHRWGGFAIRMSIPFPFVYRYGWRVTVFSLRSESETFTAIETVETVANNAATTAGSAATTATNAEAAAGAVLGIAENADAKATQAQDTANAALDSVQDALNGAQQTGKEFMVASAGVVLGRNEVNIGPSVVVPPGRDFRATSVTYGLEQNTGGIAIELLKISPTRAATVMHTANIPANQLEYQATGLNIPVENGYRYACNVIGLVGQASVLLCSVDGALL